MEEAPRHLPGLKTDRAGLVRIPRETRRCKLEEFDQSGLSGLTFTSWRRPRALAAGKEATSSKPKGPPELIQFVEAHVPIHINAQELGIVSQSSYGSRLGIV